MFSVDRTKQYLEVIKTLLTFSFLTFDAFVLLLLYPGNEIWLVAAMILFSVCSFSINGLCLELGAEISFPHVSEITVNTLLNVSAQFFSLAFTLVAPYLGIPLSETLLAVSTCDSGGTANDPSSNYHIPFTSVFTSLFTTVPTTTTSLITTTLDPSSAPLDYRYFTFALVLFFVLMCVFCVTCLYTEYHRLAFDHMPRRLHFRTASRSVTYAFAPRRDRALTCT